MRTMKDIPGTNGAYSVDEFGRVRSNPRKDALGRTWGGKFLTPRANRDGHLVVDLRVSGKRIRRYVHQLVLEAFVSPRPSGMEGCHNDGVPANNQLDNLRWDTRASNSRDAVKHGHLRGRNHHRAKLTELEVRWIRYLKVAGVCINMLAEAYGVSRSNIESIIHRKTWAWT